MLTTVFGVNEYTLNWGNTVVARVRVDNVLPTFRWVDDAPSYVRLEAVREFERLSTASR
jgi:hypothetical protein